jgi:invasion protein IalB
MRGIKPRMWGWSLAALTGALLISGGAAAQQPPPRTPSGQLEKSPQPETPQRTTATYEDWVVQCETPAGATPQKVCEMTQGTQVQGKNTPFSLVAIPRPVKGQPVKLLVQVPVNVSFATSVRVRTDDSDPGVTVAFARCLPVGCFAEFDLKDDVLRKIRTTGGVGGIGKLSFADATGRDVTVPLSFKGFVQAYDALSRE